jgi:DNA processing protein
LDGLGDRRRVAIVGTRRCTPDGSDIAYRLGHDLSDAGVCVISGLALGIDGAAHAGALATRREAGDHGSVGGGEVDGHGEVDGPGVGGTVGVAASGVDVVYPRQHAGLWREMVRVGAILSETPPGHPAQAWRFPSRNRLIAGLAEMVVVVECHSKGGSWHTVEAAIKRGVDVGAVPGSVRSAASVGTNRLLHEGATPVRDAQDVLDALGVFDVRRARPQAPGPAVPPGPTSPASASGPMRTMEDAVLAAVGWRPLCLDEVVERSGLPLAAVVIALERLEERGALGAEEGWWVRKAH